MWRTAWRLTGETSAAWFAWAAVAGSTTMAVLSFMIFPETPGACAVAAGVWLLVSHRGASNRAIVGLSAALAALPWLHTRFSVLAGARRRRSGHAAFRQRRGQRPIDGVVPFSSLPFQW